MPVLTLDGDASGAVKAHADLDSAVKRSQRGYDDAAKAAMEMERAAKKIVQENESPQDRFNRKIEELTKLFNAGKVSADQQARAIENYKVQMEEAVASQNRLADSKYHKSLETELRTLPQLTSSTATLMGEYTLTGASLDKVSEGHEKAFGAQAIGHVVEFVAQMFALEKSVEMVTEALNDQAEERRRLREDTSAALLSYGQLGAVGGTQRDVEFARRLQAEGIVKTESEAATATKGIVTAHLSDEERSFVFELAKSKRISGTESGDFALGIKGFQERYGAKAGSFENVSKEMLAAASISGQDPTEIARAMGRLGPVAQEQGIDPATAIAMYTTYARSAMNRRQALPEAEKLMKGEAEMPESMKAIFQESQKRISGSRGAELGSTLISQDPALSAQLGAEEKKASREAYIKSMSEEREGLSEEVLETIKQRAVESQGEFLGGLDAWRYEKVQHGGLFGLLPGRTGGMEDEYLSHVLNGGQLPGELNERISGYLKRSNYGGGGEDLSDLANKMDEHNAHLRRQTEIMERGDRSPPPPNGPQE
jgi:hypothetical protein